MWPFRRDGSRPGAAAPAAMRRKGRTFGTRDGVWVRSLGEKRIADFLSRRAIRYQYEPAVEGLRPDFVLPDRDPPIVIEYWGGAGFADYADRMATKTARYEAAGYDVLHLVPANLRELERVLRDELHRRGALE